MASDFSDFYILYKGHPRFNDLRLIEDDLIAVIIQKWQMICFTNRGELFGDPYFGGDLEFYLHQTRLSAESIQGELLTQINLYIPELEGTPYVLQVSIYDDPERHQEWMEIYLQIAEYEVVVAVK